MKRHTLAAGLLAVSAAAFVLTGCAGGSSKTGQTAAPQTEQEKTEVQTAAPQTEQKETEAQTAAETQTEQEETKAQTAAETQTEQKETEAQTAAEAKTGQETKTASAQNVVPTQTVYTTASALAGIDSASVTAGTESVYSRTYGLWRLDGEEGTASVYMDGKGDFVAFYASGAVEAEGHLEYVDEYGDGNGRYDMIDASGNVFSGFYFDSDTQFHIGNNGESIYILAEEEADTDETDLAEDLPEAGVLVHTPGFTGLTPVETNNDYHGGYYYSDRTEDSLTTIVNTAFASDYSAGDYESLEDYIAKNLTYVEESEAREANVEWNEEQSSRFTYSVYYATWLTGWNEDTTDWTAMFLLTDHYTYAYAFGTDADFAEEMKETWYETFDQIELTFPAEELSAEALADAGFNAEDFFGCWEYTNMPIWVYIKGDGTYDWINGNGIVNPDNYYIEGYELVLQGNGIHLFFDENGLTDSDGDRLVPSVPPEFYDPYAGSADYEESVVIYSDPGDNTDSDSSDSYYSDDSYTSDAGDAVTGSDPGEYGSQYYASDPGDYGADENGFYDGSPVITSENFYGSWESAAGDGVLTIYGDGTYERTWWNDGSVTTGSYWMDGVTLCLDSGQTYYVNLDVIVQGDGTIFYTYAGY